MISQQSRPGWVQPRRKQNAWLTRRGAGRFDAPRARSVPGALGVVRLPQPGVGGCRPAGHLRNSRRRRDPHGARSPAALRATRRTWRGRAFTSDVSSAPAPLNKTMTSQQSRPGWVQPRRKQNAWLTRRGAGRFDAPRARSVPGALGVVRLPQPGVGGCRPAGHLRNSRRRRDPHGARSPAALRATRRTWRGRAFTSDVSSAPAPLNKTMTSQQSRPGWVQPRRKENVWLTRRGAGRFDASTQCARSSRRSPPNHSRG